MRPNACFSRRRGGTRSIPLPSLTYAAVAERLNHAVAARTALIDYGALVPEEPDFGARAGSIARLSLRLNDQATAASWVSRGLEKDPGNAALQALDTRVK